MACRPVRPQFKGSQGAVFKGRDLCCQKQTQHDRQLVKDDGFGNLLLGGRTASKGLRVLLFWSLLGEAPMRRSDVRARDRPHRAARDSYDATRYPQESKISQACHRFTANRSAYLRWMTYSRQGLDMADVSQGVCKKHEPLSVFVGRLGAVMPWVARRKQVHRLPLLRLVAIKPRPIKKHGPITLAHRSKSRTRSA